jgi:hypothetical protein
MDDPWDVIDRSGSKECRANSLLAGCHVTRSRHYCNVFLPTF